MSFLITILVSSGNNKAYRYHYYKAGMGKLRKVSGDKLVLLTTKEMTSLIFMI